MNAGAQYGLFLAVVFFAAWLSGPAPVAVLCILGALQLLVGAAVIWRRTRLPYATAANVAGAIGLATAAYLFARSMDLFVFSWPVLLCAVMLISGSLLLGIESRVHRREWEAWREYMEGKNILDILAGRHIPPLRQERFPPNPV